jgi:ATP-dependent DNA helicase RecG
MQLRESIPTAKVTEQVEAQVSEQVGGQVKAALLACEHEAKSKQEILQTLGFANVYLNYKRHIVPLLEQNLLERTIPDKPNSRLQKYRLTTKTEDLRLKKTGKLP